jgi:hypothetical protein
LNTKSKHAPITHDFFLLTTLFNFGTKIKNDCTIEKHGKNLAWSADKPLQDSSLILMEVFLKAIHNTTIVFLQDNKAFLPAFEKTNQFTTKNLKFNSTKFVRKLFYSDFNIRMIY